MAVPNRADKRWPSSCFIITMTVTTHTYFERRTDQDSLIRAFYKALLYFPYVRDPHYVDCPCGGARHTVLLAYFF